MSGSLLNSVCIPPKPQNWPLRLAIKLGYTGSDTDKDVLDFLQAADPVRMVEEQKNIILPEERNNIAFAFGPHIEPYITKDTFISKKPIESCRTAWGNDIDILIGGTSDEGMAYLTLMARDPTFLASVKLEDAIPKELNLSADDPKRVEFVDRIRKFYYGSNEPTEDKLSFCKVKLPNEKLS